MAADGTSVRSAALCKNSDKEVKENVNDIELMIYSGIFNIMLRKGCYHTYNKPHGFDQPTKSVSWYVSADSHHWKSAMSTSTIIRQHTSGGLINLRIQHRIVSEA